VAPVTVLLAAAALFTVAAPGYRWNVAVVLGCVAGPMAVGFVSCYLRGGRQPRSNANAPDLVAVLETFDPAEAAHARLHLRQRGIEVEVALEALHAVSSPPGSMRRVLVHFSIAEQAYGLLSEGGFNVGVAGVRQPRDPRRRQLRLIEGTADARPRIAPGRAPAKSPR
jgi:hypothetical protein